jgi:hypothetical protein
MARVDYEVPKGGRMLKDFDWSQLEPGAALSLTPGELLLLDWILCPASGLIPGTELEQLIRGWEGVRQAIWGILAEIDLGKDARYPLPLNMLDAQYIFAVTPTTFRWGTGPDCGFSLKRRLYLFIQGLTPPEDLPKQETPPTQKPAMEPIIDD